MINRAAREGQTGRAGVAERLVVPRKPGNAGGGKGPQFKADARRGEADALLRTYWLPESEYQSADELTVQLYVEALAGYPEWTVGDDSRGMNHRRVHHSRQDRVRPYALPGVLQRDHAGELNNCGLRRRIG